MSVASVEHAVVLGNLPSSVFSRTKEWRNTRYAALKHYGNRCQLCGASPSEGVELHVDHIYPRSQYPDRCLDISNLQILCRTCHMAKGEKYIDDFRDKFSQVTSRSLQSFFHLSLRHKPLEYRTPRGHEVKWFGEGVVAENKNQRKRWRMLVDFMAKEKMLYEEAVVLTVAEVSQLKTAKNTRMVKFYNWGGGGFKSDADIFFDIAGAVFPKNINDLIVVRQGETP